MFGYSDKIPKILSFSWFSKKVYIVLYCEKINNFGLAKSFHVRYFLKVFKVGRSTLFTVARGQSGLTWHKIVAIKANIPEKSVTTHPKMKYII